MSKKQTSLIKEIKENISSFSPIIRNGWFIKLSTYKETNILLLFNSLHTGQSFVRYFDNEEDAITYINMVIIRGAYDNISI